MKDNTDHKFKGTAIKKYHKLIQRKRLFLWTGCVLLLVLLITDMLTGPAGIGFDDIYKAAFFPAAVSNSTRIIIWVLRLPVALMALVVGAALGIAGAQMQTILSNPLASPYTLGVSSAASLGAACAIVLSKNLTGIAALVTVPVSAFAFAILSTLMIYFITKNRYQGAHTIILIGVALSFLFSSLLTLVQYSANENELQAIVFWMFGSLQGASWGKIAIVLMAVVLSLPVLLSDAWKLTALSFGDEKVKSLGVNVTRLRLKTLFVIAVLTAVAVCFVGTIGFVGLVAPHLARTLVGEDQRFFLPGAALLGAVMLSFSSIASKVLIPGAVFPVGITTSLIGIPFLLFVIFKGQRS